VWGKGGGGDVNRNIDTNGENIGRKRVFQRVGEGLRGQAIVWGGEQRKTNEKKNKRVGVYIHRRKGNHCGTKERGAEEFSGGKKKNSNPPFVGIGEKVEKD